MMQQTFRIAGWSEIYENARSKEYKNCSYLCVPNRGNNLGVISVLSEPDGAAIFGNFILIARLCSLQFKPREGWLTDNGRQDGVPYTLATLALELRRPKAEVARTLIVTSSPSIGWITPEFKIPALNEQEQVELLGAGRFTRLQLQDGSANPDSGSARPELGSARKGAHDEVNSSIIQNGSVNPDFGSARPDSGSTRPLTEQKETEEERNPLPSPKGGFEEAAIESDDPLQYSEAKLWFNTLFHRTRKWSYEEDQLLSQIVPISRDDKELIDWAYGLAPSHRFQEQTKLKQELTTLLREFNGEVDKIKTVRRRMGLNGAPKVRQSLVTQTAA